MGFACGFGLFWSNLCRLFACFFDTFWIDLCRLLQTIMKFFVQNFLGLLVKSKVNRIFLMLSDMEPSWLGLALFVVW